MANKYLDDAGLTHVWSKIKTWLASWKIEQFGAGEISINENAHFKVTGTGVSITNDDDDFNFSLSDFEFAIKGNSSLFTASKVQINFGYVYLAYLTFSYSNGFGIYKFNGGKVTFDNQLSKAVHGYMIGFKSGALKGARFTIEAKTSASNQTVDLDTGYPVIVVWQSA